MYKLGHLQYLNNWARHSLSRSQGAISWVIGTRNLHMINYMHKII